MVHKKAKSKRIPTRMREKIKKKVREHHRKQRKEIRKDALQNGPRGRSGKKDLGIPNLYPYKKALLLRAQARSERSKLKGDASKPQKIFKGLDFGDIARSAESRAREYTHQKVDPEIGCGDDLGSVPDPSVKAYYKEFRKVVDASDVILEVLDCRDPLGCRPKNIERMIVESSVNKRIILILNKIDLVPKKAVLQWLKYLRNELPTVAFRSSTQESRNHSVGYRHLDISVETAPQRLLKKGDCVGADNLMSLLKNFCRVSGVKTSIVVGVIGYPNVGKSSIINSLKRIKVCNTGSDAGVTKSMQQINLDKNIKLLDCPGIVFRKRSSVHSRDSGSEALLKNLSKKNRKTDMMAEAASIINRCDRLQLSRIYGLQSFVDSNDFLVLLARQRGHIRKGGIPDVELAAEVLVSEWNSGRIAFYTLPPSIPEGSKGSCYLSTEIVSTWSKEFNIEDILKAEDSSIMEIDAAAIAGGRVKPIAAKPSLMSESHHIYDDSNNDHIMDSPDDDPAESGLTNPQEDQSAGVEVNIAIERSTHAKRVRFDSSCNGDPLTPEERMLNPTKYSNIRSRKASSSKKVHSTSMEYDLPSVDDDRYNFEEHFASITMPNTEG